MKGAVNRQQKKQKTNMESENQSLKQRDRDPSETEPSSSQQAPHTKPPLDLRTSQNEPVASEDALLVKPESIVLTDPKPNNDSRVNRRRSTKNVNTQRYFKSLIAVKLNITGMC